MYYYPIELENRFIKAISCSKIDEALKVIDIIFENNFVNRTLTAERIEELFGEISSSLNKIKLIYFSDEERIDYRVSDLTIKSFFEIYNGPKLGRMDTAINKDKHIELCYIHKKEPYSEI